MEKFGQPEVPYSNRDIEAALAEYAGEAFAKDFFGKYIFDSQMPDYESLLATVGVEFGKANPGQASLGTNIRIENGVGTLRSNAIKGSPIYEAGIEATDEITAIAGVSLNSVNTVDQILSDHNPGDVVSITYERWGEERTAQATLAEDTAYKTELMEAADSSQENHRNAWLN